MNNVKTEKNESTQVLNPIQLMIISIMPKTENEKDFILLNRGKLHNPVNGSCACECAIDESGSTCNNDCASDCYMCE